MHHLIIIILLIKMGLMFIFLCILCVVQLLNADLDCMGFLSISLKKRGVALTLILDPLQRLCGPMVGKPRCNLKNRIW